MYRIRSWLVFIIGALTLCVALAACAPKETGENIPENGPDTVFYVPVTINDTPYLKQVWVPEDWDGEDGTDCPFSFYLTKIEDGVIEGRWSQDRTAIPDRSDDPAGSSQWASDLIGMVENGLAKCELWEDGNPIGRVTWIFQQDFDSAYDHPDAEKIYAILADIVYTDGEAAGSLAGRVRFRPYRFSAPDTDMPLRACDPKETDENRGRADVPKSQSDRIFYELEAKDYAPYLKPIWVPEDWDGKEDWTNYPFSFYLTKIENGVIEGKWSQDRMAMPDCYDDPTCSPLWISNLTGTVENGVAKCELWEDGNPVGSMTLVFRRKSNFIYDFEAQRQYDILADITYADGEAAGNLTGKAMFRPYQLSDLDADLLNVRAFTVELNSWGTVRAVSVVDRSDKPYPRVFLANRQGEILYQFGDGFLTGTRSVDIVAEDFNKDGFKDVKITNGFYDYDTGEIYSDMPLLEFMYCQTENGWFYFAGSQER